MLHMRIVLLGCPGAGKGTQAKLICKRYNIPQISTGDILRSAIQSDTPLGLKIKAIVESGSLVTDNIMIEVVKNRLQEADCAKGFLLDGFPRTIHQAEALRKITPIDFVIDIDVPENEIIKRLSGRRIHPASGRTYHIDFQKPANAGYDDITGEPLIQRPDDQEEAIRKRLHVYQEQTSPLRDYYSQLPSHTSNHPHYLKINGLRPVTEIHEELFKLLDMHVF